MFRARMVLPICFLLILFSACITPRYVVDRDEARFLVGQLEALYAEAEALIVHSVQGNVPLSEADRARLSALRSEAATLYGRLKEIAEERGDDAGLLLKLAGALLEVLP